MLSKFKTFTNSRLGGLGEIESLPVHSISPILCFEQYMLKAEELETLIRGMTSYSAITCYPATGGVQVVVYSLEEAVDYCVEESVTPEMAAEYLLTATTEGFQGDILDMIPCCC